jgi:hypothetical protein
MYAYLSVVADDCDVVEFPERPSAVVARGEGAGLAETWTASPGDVSAAPRDHVSDAHLMRRRAEHQAWSERLDAALVGGSITANRLIREEFVRDNPEPLLDAAPDAAGAPAAAPRVHQARWWRARAEIEPGVLDEWLAVADDPFPRAAVARMLSELSGRGWTLRHVSEGRRAIHADENTRTEVNEAWFLLERQ